MTEHNFTPDYTRLETEAAINPVYVFGRRWEDATEKARQIMDYLDGLYEHTGPIDGKDVEDMNRLNEYLDAALQLISSASKD